MEEIIPTPKSDVKEMTYNELKEDVEELEYYDRTEPNREEALSELARITRELEEQANEEKVQEDLRRIEDAREKEAIISYDELLRKTANMNIIDDEENAVISINELNHKEEDPVKAKDLRKKSLKTKMQIKNIEYDIKVLEFSLDRSDTR